MSNKNKIILLLSLLFFAAVPAQKAQSMSADRTWGLIGAATGIASLGLHGLNFMRDRGYMGGGYYGGGYGGGYYAPASYSYSYPTYSYPSYYYSSPYGYSGYGGYSSYCYYCYGY